MENKQEIEKKYNELCQVFIEEEIFEKEADLPVLSKISLIVVDLAKLLFKHAQNDLGEKILVFDKLVNSFMFCNLSYSKVFKAFSEVQIIIEELMEGYLNDGYIDSKKIGKINVFEKNFFKGIDKSLIETEIPEIDEMEVSSLEETKVNKDVVDEINDREEKLDGRFGYLNLDSIDFMDDFISETTELLEMAEENMLLLEEEPENEAVIAAIFRVVHTIKGSAGFMNLKELAELSHKAENLLDKCRGNKLKINSTIITVLLNSIDILKMLLSNLIFRVKVLQKKENERELPEILIYDVIKVIKDIIDGKIIDNAPEKLGSENKNKNVTSNKNNKISNVKIGKKIEIKGLANDAVRVGIKKIDQVSELVGEIMIGLSVLKESAERNSAENKMIIEAISNLDMLTETLQNNILKMRMFPIKSVYEKLKRQVRDLIQKANKQVEFITIGAEVEVDKTVIDEIYGPLTHIIRNSMDHGVEKSDVRESKGKIPKGRIILKTENRGDNVVIEIQDDGAGLNKKKILKKAIENKVISENEKLEEAEIYNLIFRPGFSTAEKITEISGRGVGMDVVKSAIKKLGGRIVIDSEENVGTTFFIILPLSTSIIEGLVTKVGNNKFILPLLKTKHSISGEDIKFNNTLSAKEKFVVFGNKSVPIIDLDEFYNGRHSDDYSKKVVLIAEYEHRMYGLLADEILYKQKIVSKSLNKKMLNVCGVRSGAVMGDGSVGLVIEPDEVIKNFLENK